MARRYDRGVIVGEPEPPKTLPEIIKWCADEHALACTRRDAEHNPHTQAYLVGREAALSQVLTMLDGVP